MLNKNKFALTFGLFASFMHLVWIILVALGLGQTWMNFAHRMHFLSHTNTNTVMPFDFLHAIGLIILAFVMGYVISYIFATIWNKVHTK